MNRNSFFLLCLLLCSLALFSQKHFHNFSNHRSGDDIFSKDKYILDSTYFWLGHTLGESWFNQKIFMPESYNENGDLLKAYDYEYDTIALYWYQQRLYDGQYYQNGFRKRWLTFIFDQSQNNWRMSDSIYFNQTGKPVTSWYKTWNPLIAGFTGGRRSAYFYDDNERPHIQYNQVYDTATQRWVRTDYDVMYYSAKNLDSLKISYAWNGATMQWHDSLKLFFYYNNDQLLSQELTQVFVAGNWTNTTLSNYSYNDIGNIELKNEYSWDQNINDWVNKNKSDYLYNSQQLISERTDFIWDGTQWLNKTRITYQYNSHGLTSEILNQYWSFGFNQWANASLSTYTYDEHLNRKLFSFYTWNPLIENWRNFYKEENYWAFFESSNIYEPNSYSFNILPNPASDLVSFDFGRPPHGNATIHLFFYNISGQQSKVIETNETSGTIDISDLQPGTYLLIYSFAGHTGSTILIKK